MDLYSDLDIDPFFPVEHEDSLETVSGAAAIAAELEELKSQNGLLSRQNLALRKNISCLYKTARSELQRKDTLIASLTTRLQQVEERGKPARPQPTSVDTHSTESRSSTSVPHTQTGNISKSDTTCSARELKMSSTDKRSSGNDKENKKSEATGCRTRSKTNLRTGGPSSKAQLKESKERTINERNTSQKEDKRLPNGDHEKLTKKEPRKLRESKTSSKDGRKSGRSSERRSHSTTRETRAREALRRPHKRSRSRSREPVCRPKRKRLSRSPVAKPRSPSPFPTPGKISQEFCPVEFTKGSSVCEDLSFLDVDLEATPLTPGRSHTLSCPSPPPSDHRNTSQKLHLDLDPVDSTTTFVVVSEAGESGESDLEEGEIVSSDEATTQIYTKRKRF